MMAREEIINEDRDIASGLLKGCGAVGHTSYFKFILVCETLNERWAVSGSERRTTAKDFLEYYAAKYVIATDGAYLSSSSSRPCFFDLSSAGRVWNDNFLWVSGECLQRSYKEPLELNNRTITKGINCKVSRKESFIDAVAREGTELEAVLKELEISRFKRVASKDDKVRRSQAKRRMATKTSGSMEKILPTLELNIPLKLARLNEMPDGPVDMATIFSTVVRNLAKRKAIKKGPASRSITSDSVDDSSKRRKVTSPTKSQVVLEESDKIAEGVDLRPCFEAEAGLLEEQCRAKAREKMVAVMDDEFKKLGFQDRSIELEKRTSQLEGEKNQLEENLTREREAFQLELEIEREAAALKLKEVRAERKLYQLRYTKAEIMAFSEGNYEEKEIMNEEEVEEMKDGLNVAEKTTADSQEIINQEIESLRLRVVDLEGLLEVEKKSSAELHKELDVVRGREEQTLLYNAEYAEEYEEKVASGSQYVAELAEYRIRALNEEISDMKCNIRALNEQLLKREIDLDAARTNLAVPEANFEKLSSSIVGKDQEFPNSVQIRDSLIARLDRLKADLRCLKGIEAQSRADLVEIQANNKSLVDDLAHARGNVRRLCNVRRRRMKELINSVREFPNRIRNYVDGEISSCEGSREMKEFLRRKEELVENMRIDLTSSLQKSIDLIRQMSERIDQLITELAESKARRWKDNKRTTVTHQAFKELVVHEQEKCDGEALHQRQLSALVAFFVEEIKFLQVERDLMQYCFSGRTCVSKLDISSIDPIGVMDRGIGTKTAEQITQGRKIIVERAP
ncbi:hypothetical protein GIB67_032770 [Kingdonia uniflora]|uniref:Uncharacterized protein n=1 Tax=Kingdonia uniflora TaxID=39325 RepID=A0A7J7MW94_9MAGN|nr:hypothetical protein GIB67_032770 [Kingdonia uniflora]